MKYAVPMNAQRGEFEVHATGCRDLHKPWKRRDFNLARGEEPEEVEAAGPDEAARAALDSQFSSEDEHPAEDGHPGGSFGAAGFTARVFPCARKS